VRVEPLDKPIAFPLFEAYWACEIFAKLYLVTTHLLRVPFPHRKIPHPFWWTNELSTQMHSIATFFDAFSIFVRTIGFLAEMRWASECGAQRILYAALGCGIASGIVGRLVMVICRALEITTI
jgi:hypothetical protein